MALSTLASVTDAIPLLDDNGSGAYIKGRNTAQKIRRQLLGQLFGKSGGNYAWRPGVLTSNYDTTALVYNGLRVIPLGSPGQGVQIIEGRAIQERTGQGPYLLSQDGTLTNVSMPAADASNPRYDVIYMYGYDKGYFGSDAQHGPKFLVETGTPAASPSVPSIPSDAIPLANVFRRTTGASPSGNIIQSGDITDRRKSASLQGTPRFLLPGDALSDAGGYHGERRLRAGAFVPAGISPTILEDRWNATTSKWHGTQDITIAQPGQTFSGLVVNGATQTITSVTIADLGFDYTVVASGSFEFTSTTQGALIGIQVTGDSTSVDTNVCAKGLSKVPGTGSDSKPAQAVPVCAPVFAAGSSHVFRLLCRVYAEPLDIGVSSGGLYGFGLVIVPV